jgi:hypothetical protein
MAAAVDPDPAVRDVDGVGIEVAGPLAPDFTVGILAWSVAHLLFPSLLKTGVEIANNPLGRLSKPMQRDYFPFKASILACGRGVYAYDHKRLIFRVGYVSNGIPDCSLCHFPSPCQSGP